MKFLISWGVRLALAAGISVISGLGFNSSSLALPEPQVIQKLDQIPMFIIVNQEGDLVLVNPKTESNESTPKPGLIIFGDYNDALKMLDNLQTNNSNLQGNIQIIPISFGKVYEMLKELKEDPENTPPMILYSEQEEVLAAEKLREGRGENVEDLKKLGLPLFFVTTGQEDDFIVKEDEAGKAFIPFYMDLKEAQADLEKYKQQFPNVSPQEVKIQVIPLLSLIQVWLEKDEETIKIMEVIPSEQQVNEANRLINNLQAKPSN
ncbi:hypothetical protein PCC7424_1452 [Gloeothece citriformis PCC 7424]|uniref:Tic22 family protein n=1 Tax=Gloeothece citriformis (strain PCC 7424) TaxID=65393 RepID=B7K8D4_GLOC7|nr:Tic22 family protein [Gloeothece citriformis]ACK69894.1 hypothetical protein PCC7424_1452 [Gloeothece citriformis PCC 7424]